MKVSITIHHSNGVAEAFNNVKKESVRFQPVSGNIQFKCLNTFNKETIITTNAEYTIRESEE